MIGSRNALVLLRFVRHATSGILGFILVMIAGSGAALADFGLANMQTGLCAQPEGSGAPGVRVIIERCNGSPEQAWSIQQPTIYGDRYFLWEGGRGPNGVGLVMDIRPNAFDVAGAEIVLAPYGGIQGPAVRLTQFRYVDVSPPRNHFGTVFNKYRVNGQLLCLASLPTVGAPLINARCRDEPGQFFTLYDRSVPVAANEPVLCSVFEDGYSHISPPVDAVYFGNHQNARGQACIPDGSARGLCRRWFGHCYSARTFQSVMFGVFDDGASNFAGISDAVYIRPQGNSACIPGDGAWGTCRRWFGLARTVPGGRSVACAVFDDGYANRSNHERATYVPRPIPADGRACIPDGSPLGTCRRWFGQCVVQ